MEYSTKLGLVLVAGASLAGMPRILAADLDALVPSGTNAVGTTKAWLEPARLAVWNGAVGEGFNSSTVHLSLAAGVGAGLTVLGSREAHNLAWLGLAYGRMWGAVQGGDSWYRGNWERRLEVIGGGQFRPSDRYVVGLTPHLRYNFATGSRWLPFVDVGAGASGTSIGPQDLGGAFQFNLQAGPGLSWFLREDVALSFEYRFFHLSSARLSTPNRGVNTGMFLVGMNWYF